MITLPDHVRSLQTVFTTTADTLARQTGFVQRESKLTGAVFAQTLVFGWLANPQMSLDGLTRVAETLGVTIRAQSLDERFTERAAVYLEELLRAAVKTVIAADPVAIPLLERFRAVELLDSTTITLPPAVAVWWPGCTAGTAALKVHVRYDLCCGQLSRLVGDDGRTSDRSTSVQSAPLPPGALRVSDLGYFSLDTFAAVTDAYWLSRFYQGTAVFTPDGQRWDVRTLIEAQETSCVDLVVTLGVEQRLPARLLALRVAPNVADQRRTRLHQRARDKGETLSAARLEGCDWVVLVTNVPPKLLTLDEALVLLTARWQVELLFKLWKDEGQVDTSRSTQPWRIVCEVFAKLLAMVVQHWILLTGSWSVPNRSLIKAVQTIRAHSLSLAHTFRCALQLCAVLEDIQRCLAHGCRLNRRKKKPNTYHLLLDPSLQKFA